jgi:hypothetical protein
VLHSMWEAEGSTCVDMIEFLLFLFGCVILVYVLFYALASKPMMEIKAPLRRISFKYQLGRLREHEQRSSRMYSTDSFKSYGLKQIHGGLLSMIHVGNK